MVTETTGLAHVSSAPGSRLASIHLLSLGALCVLAEMGLLTANYAKQSLFFVVNLLNCYSMLIRCSVGFVLNSYLSCVGFVWRSIR